MSFWKISFLVLSMLIQWSPLLSVYLAQFSRGRRFLVTAAEIGVVRRSSRYLIASLHKFQGHQISNYNSQCNLQFQFVQIMKGKDI